MSVTHQELRVKEGGVGEMYPCLVSYMCHS